jgi:hypothetical protein
VQGAERGYTVLYAIFFCFFGGVGFYVPAVTSFNLTTLDTLLSGSGSSFMLIFT